MISKAQTNITCVCSVGVDVLARGTVEDLSPGLDELERQNQYKNVR